MCPPGASETWCHRTSWLCKTSKCTFAFIFHVYYKYAITWKEDEVSESGSISDSDEETSKTSGPKTASGPDATTTNEESKEADAPNEMMDAEVKEVDEVLSEEGKEVKENDDVVEGEKDKIKEEEKDGGDSSVDPSASDAKVNGEEEKDTNTEGKDDDKDKENDAESNGNIKLIDHLF